MKVLLVTAASLAFAALQFFVGWEVLGAVGNGAAMGRPEADTVLFFTGFAFVLFSPLTAITAIAIQLTEK